MQFINIIKKHSLMILLLILCFISVLSIASAAPLMSNVSNPNRMWIMQLIYYGIGLLTAYYIYKIVGMESLYSHIKVFYWIFMILLLGLAIDHIAYTRLIHRHIVPFANYVNGSTCWYNLKIFSFQPSEFMKIIMVLYLAQMTKDYNAHVIRRTMTVDINYIKEVLKISIPPAILIFLENDTGVIMIMMMACFFILLSSGINSKWFIYFFSIVGIIVIIMVLLFLFQNDLFGKLIGGHRLDRFYGWLDPEGTAGNQGMQLWFSQLSYGTSSWFGHGFRSNVMSFPEAQTDFIFAVIASHAGFIGALLTIIVIVIFDIVLLNIGLHSTDERDMHYMMGILGCLIFQQVWNIGMVLGLLPITGITLPLISYGGSSLLSYLFSMSIFFDIDYKNRINSHSL